jgi:hypothetical protein
MGGCATMGALETLSESPVDQDVDITLSMKGKMCGVKPDGVRPDHAYLKLSRKDKIKWHVHNENCGTQTNIEILFDANDPYPFEPTCKNDKKIPSLGQGQTKTITCKLTTSPTTNVPYPYKVYINGSPVMDPDVEVWP